MPQIAQRMNIKLFKLSSNSIVFIIADSSENKIPKDILKEKHISGNRKYIEEHTRHKNKILSIKLILNFLSPGRPDIEKWIKPVILPKQYRGFRASNRLLFIVRMYLTECSRLVSLSTQTKKNH